LFRKSNIGIVPKVETSRATMARMKHQELLKGLIRLHILHHAAKDEFYGQWMIHELARHGYTLSPGTLYPMLHQLERSGYLRSRDERLGRTYRRIYRATALGKEANKLAKIQVRELTGGRKPTHQSKSGTYR
jgi:PadR family transcriptional regulator, regulatory protein PadR